jgi:ribosomal protein L7/L12
MSKIFISYRRNDSQYVTDSIYMALKGLFGDGNVFLDVGNIPFGVDFRQYLREQIEAHDVVLVIIGPDWAKMMKERAEQANDFVRIEIENALKLNKLVIPILVMNASMPDFGDLPPSIAELQWRNNTQIRRQPDLEGDCKRLADGIKAYFANQAKASPNPQAQTTPRPTENKVPATDLLPRFRLQPLQDSNTLLPEAQRYNVILKEVGPNAQFVVSYIMLLGINQLKSLRSEEAEALVKKGHGLIMENVSEDAAIDAKTKLERVGAIVQITPPLPLTVDKPATPAYADDEIQTEYNVILKAVGPNKIEVMKAIRTVTNFDLKEAKAIVENTPAIVIEQVGMYAALDAKKHLEAAGATVYIQ